MMGLLRCNPKLSIENTKKEHGREKVVKHRKNKESARMFKRKSSISREPGGEKALRDTQQHLQSHGVRTLKTASHVVDERVRTRSPVTAGRWDVPGATRFGL